MKRILPWLLVPFGLIISQTPTPQTGVNQSQLHFIVSLTPAQTVTIVNSTTPNSFPIPSGRTVCIVTRNIAQSLGVDYTIVSNAVVFNQTPQVGDVVQLNCF